MIIYYSGLTDGNLRNPRDAVNSHCLMLSYVNMQAKELAEIKRERGEGLHIGDKQGLVEKHNPAK